MKQALTKKLGPLPRWGWLVALGLLVGLYIYRQRQAAQAAAQSTTQPSPDVSQTQAAVSPYGQDSAGSYGGTFPVSGGGSGFDPTSFQQGLFYGQQFGTQQQPGNNNNGSPAPTPVGPTNITIDTRTPTRNTHHKSERLAGGSPPPDRHPLRHLKDKGPNLGYNPSVVELNSGGHIKSTKPKGTIKFNTAPIRLRSNH